MNNLIVVGIFSFGLRKSGDVILDLDLGSLGATRVRRFARAVRRPHWAVFVVA